MPRFSPGCLSAAQPVPQGGVDRWINSVLGITASRLMEDRVLHEAEAIGGDPRRICDLFGLSVGAVLRYTGPVDESSLAERSLRNRV